MGGSLGRLWMAVALTAGAMLIPLGAWYAVGSRETAREAAALEGTPLLTAREEALRLAGQMALRLEALREAESRRPFYHYQNLYHEPKGAYQGGDSVVPSPLAEGPADPLVRVYFQVDASDRLTLPTLNEELPELNSPQLVQEQGPLLAELAPMARQCRPSPGQVAQDFPQGAQVETLESGAWEQNAAANKIYTEVQQRKLGKGENPQRRASGKGAVAIRVGALSWRTLQVGGAPGLLALREVETPAGPLVQGFQISPVAVAALLKGASLPARFLPGDASGPVSAALDGLSWHVAVEPGQALAEGRTLGARRRAAFRRTFLLGAGFTGLAGLSLIALVWQSDRLARQRSRFAASAAHELRTPLAGLRMYGEMLAEGLGEPARYKDYARRVADEAERLGRVVSNVLGFSRLERRALQVRTVRADLGASVREAVARQRPALEAAGMRLESRLPEGLLEAFFDPDAVAQILQNLLDNAEKYTRGCPDRTVTVSLAREGAAFLVRVEDLGPGVPMALRGRLFRPFSRGETADAPAGLGLGLALSRALARAQGGDLLIEEGPGARFMLSVPA